MRRAADTVCHVLDRVGTEDGEHEMTATEHQAITGLLAVVLEAEGHPWQVSFYPDHDQASTECE